MKLHIKHLAAIALSLTLAACASTPPPQMVADCTFPDSPEVAAPEWVCEVPVPGIEVSAVGSFRATGAGTSFQKTQAAAAARNQLASQMKVHVKRLVKNYVETTGVGDDETVDAVSSDVSKQITNEKLHSTKIFKIRVNPKTKVMYVLVGMDPSSAASNAQAALQTSYKNNQAMWQRLVANKAHAELDAEIEKIANQQLGPQ